MNSNDDNVKDLTEGIKVGALKQNFLHVELGNVYTAKVLDYLMTNNGLYVIGYSANNYDTILGLSGNLAELSNNKLSAFSSNNVKTLVNFYPSSLSSNEVSDDISKILVYNNNIYYCSDRASNAIKDNEIKDWEKNNLYSSDMNFKPLNFYTYYEQSYYIDNDTEAPKIKRYQITFDDTNKEVDNKLVDTTSFYYQIIPATKTNQDE